jgi:hypothetical protein
MTAAVEVRSADLMFACCEAAFGQQQSMAMSSNAVQPVTIKTPDGAMPGTDSYATDPYNGKDAVANGGRLAPGDPSRRAFAYFMMGSARCVLLFHLSLRQARETRREGQLD